MSDEVEDAMDEVARFKETMIGLRNSFINEGVGADIADEIMMETMRGIRVANELELVNAKKELREQNPLSDLFGRITGNG